MLQHHGMSGPSVHGEADAPPMRIVIVGHVDHGKSTLIGRLFHDTGSLPDGRLEAIQASCERRGVPFEWAFLMDALQSEREQNITIDSAQIWFQSAARRYVIIDAPGHIEFLKNMVTGAASAEAAVIMVAADEGVKDQSRRHGMLLHLLGIRQVVVAVNKMDLIAFDEAGFQALADEYTDFLRGLGVTPRVVIPVSARGGDNIASASAAMPWYDGPTLLGALDALQREAPPPDQPLRVVVQDVYRFDARRIIAGRVEAGTLRVGDRVRFYPGGEAQVVSRLEAWAEDAPESVHAGQSIGFTLADQIFVERGMVAAHEGRPPRVARRFVASLFWMGREAMRVGADYRLKLLTADVPCRVVALRGSLDPVTRGEAEDRLERHGAAEVIVETREPVAFDLHAELGVTGRFVIVAGYDVVGGGIITDIVDIDDGGDESRPIPEAVIAARDAEADLLAARLRARGDTVLCLTHDALEELARLAERAATAEPETFRDRVVALGSFLGGQGIGLVAVAPDDEG